MRNIALVPLLALLILPSCRVGPSYRTPDPIAPQEWKSPNKETEVLPDVENWWEVFQDEKLNSLEKEALSRSPTLSIALYRIEEAWAIAGIARADLFPQLTVNPIYSDTGELFKLFVPKQFATIIPPSTGPDIFRIHQFEYALPFNLSYQLDLWGKYKSSHESAAFNAEAEEEAYRTALLGLTSDLASAYYNLRSLDTLINLLERTVETRAIDYEQNRSRNEKGLIGFVDVSNASLQLTNTESDLFDAKRQRAIQENRIAALMGIPASELKIEPSPLIQAPPTIPAGIPSEVLKRRPDVAQAEKNMHAKHLMINVAIADYYPSVELTGSLGFISPDYRQFLRWISRYWSMGAQGNQTLFDGGRKSSSEDVSWARFGEAAGHYQQTILTAFKEVEDALIAIEYETKQSLVLESSVNAAKITKNLSEHKYTSGLISYTDVVDSQRQQLNAERALAGILGVRYQSTINLIKALGGGWKNECDEVAHP